MLLVAAGFDLRLAEPTAIERFDIRQQLPQPIRPWDKRLLLELPPPRPGTKQQVLLTGHGNDGNGRITAERPNHGILLALAGYQPVTVNNEVAVVAHALRLVLAGHGCQFVARFLEAKKAGVAHDVARHEFVIVGEGRPNPVRKQQSAAG